MARINVEQKALTDPRFSILGSHLAPLNNAPRDSVETAFGLWLMLRVWNYCMERGLLVVPSRDLEAIYPGLAEAIVDAQLGELIPRSRARAVRIKGGEGRLDWLENARDTGRQHGVKGGVYGVLGGRPKKTPKPPPPVSENPLGGLCENPLPAPAPSLNPPTPKRGKSDPHFAEVFGAYPAHRRTNLRAASKAWREIDPSITPAIVAGIEAWAKSEEWRRDGGRWVPTLAKFLAGRMWESPPTGAKAGPTSDEIEARMIERRRVAAEELQRIEEERRGHEE